MRAIWTLVCVICICSLAFGHSNNTKDDDSWILAVGTLFPDVAGVLVGGGFIEVSLDCDPTSVGRNHFWMWFFHLPPSQQLHEVGCWLAFDAAEAECMSRSPICGGMDDRMAVDEYDTWQQVCVESAERERESCIDDVNTGFTPHDHGNNPDEAY